MPPGTAQLGPLATLRLLPRMAAALGRSLPRALRGLGRMEAAHPHEPHWYLPMIGVLPERQGEGIGSALLAAVLERADRDGLPAYLEATKPRNRALYERHGFEVVEEMPIADDGPSVWRMWREAGP